MKQAMKEVCRDLRQLADDMPPGPARNQMQADLACLRMRLAALPGKAAAQLHMASAERVRAVLGKEFADAFGPIMKWMR